MAFQDMAQHTWVWAGQEETDCQVYHQLYRMARGLQLCWDLGGCPMPTSSSDSRAQEQLKSLEMSFHIHCLSRAKVSSSGHQWSRRERQGCLC